jgi:hypothetical protein
MSRKNYHYVLCLALFIIGFSGCKKVEQTELNIEDSQYFATIQGTLLYPAGVTQTDFGGTAAENQTVYVDIPYSYYSSTTPGTKRFTGTTDSQGKFSIKIPVKTTPVIIKVGVASFEGKHYIFDQFIQEGNTYIPKFVQKEVIYEIKRKNLTVSASDVKNENIVLVYNLIGVEPEFKCMTTYKFNIERVFYPKPDGPPFDIIQEWIPLSNKEVFVTVNRGGNKNTYLCKSNSYGTVLIDIPMIYQSESVNLEVKSNPFRGTLTFYEISDDQQFCFPVTKNGVFSTSGFNLYNVTLNALQVVTASSNLQFNFYED